MNKFTTVIVVLLLIVLITPSVLINYVEAPEAVVEPAVIVSRATTTKPSFSGFTITVATSDGGRIEYLFMWQRSIVWIGTEQEFILDTAPTLKMSHYYRNGTLDFSMAYIPLFLLQYNDVNENGFFDFWTQDRREVNKTIEDVDIQWEALMDVPCEIYSLAPMFLLSEKTWTWTVSELTKRSIAVNLNNTFYETYEYSWNISATVPALPPPSWLRDKHDAKLRTIDVFFGFHIRLLPEDPEVKYDFRFSNVDWPSVENAKLTMASAIYYFSKDPPVILVGSKILRGFGETMEFKPPKFMISDEVTKAIKAFVSYTSDADADGIYRHGTVKSALQPLFLPSLPPAPPPFPLEVLLELPRDWKYHMAFAHQLGLPYFDSYVSQDPKISITGELAITSPLLPKAILPLQFIVGTAVILTVIVIARHFLRTLGARPVLKFRTEIRIF
jgi:hypothetical protein